MKQLFSTLLLSVFCLSLTAKENNVFDQEQLTEQSNKACGCTYACTCDPVPATLIPCNKAYNSPLRFSSCWGVFAGGSLLYWRAAEQNLEMCVLNEFSTQYPIDGKVATFDFTYNLAFNVFLGMEFCHDYWSSYLSYTRYNNSLSKTITTKDSKPKIFPNWLLEDALSAMPDQPLIEAKGKWKLNINTIDWFISRHYYVGQYLTSRPYFGLRVAFIDQKLNIKYAPEVKDKHEHLFTSRNGISSWGIGPRVGLDNWWGFCGNYRIFSDVSGGVIFTDYTTKTKQFEILNNVKTTLISVNDDPNELKFDLQASIGLGWEDYLSYDRYHVNLTIGYDFLIFFNQNLFRRYLNNSSGQIVNGDLYLHGLTVKLGVDF